LAKYAGPDIAYTVYKSARKSENPGVPDWKID